MRKVAQERCAVGAQELELRVRARRWWWWWWW